MNCTVKVGRKSLANEGTNLYECSAVVMMVVNVEEIQKFTKVDSQTVYTLSLTNCELLKSDYTSEAIYCR